MYMCILNVCLTSISLPLFQAYADSLKFSFNLHPLDRGNPSIGLMGSIDQGESTAGSDVHGSVAYEDAKTLTVISCSMLISIVGGLVMVWWEFEYHPSNTQLWMVPVGLVLFVTPIVVWFSVFVSTISNRDSLDLEEDGFRIPTESRHPL